KPATRTADNNFTEVNSYGLKGPESIHCLRQRLDGVRCLVPAHRTLAKVRLVGEMAGKRRVVAEDDILHHRFARAHRLEEVPEVRAQVVVVIAVVGKTFGRRLLS